MKATSQDPNDVAASRSGSFTTYDALGRAIQTTVADGGQSSTTFVDALPNSATSSTLITSSVSHTSKTILDGLGRPIQSQLTSDPDGTTFVDTTYDVLGRKATVSNPYRTATDPGPTNGITSYFYDGLSRVCVLVPPDGTPPAGGVCPSTQPANTVFTVYSGNNTTVTDQAGKSRKTQTDGLGRLTRVWEDPAGLNYETDYTYDGFSNLTNVAQSGSRQRTFSYNALSQLMSAINPESGTISYTYDNAGNLATKTSWAENQTINVPIAATGSVTISGTESCASQCDQGTVSITVNGFMASTSYGSSSNSSSIASSLAFGLNSSSSPVTATVAGSVVSITSKVTGPTGNYSLSSSSSSGAPLHLAKPSFRGTPSGSALTGGANPPTTVITYAYDGLTSLTKKTYTDGTPTVTYLYDGATVTGCIPTLTPSNPVGRRSGMCDALGIEAWSYDSMGRVLPDQRTTSSISKTISYTYAPYLDGSLYQLAYPSGHTLTFAVGTADRLLSEADSANSINFATGAHYSPAGALTSLLNGANLSSTYVFNSRLQPCWLYATTGTALPQSSTNCTSTASTPNVLDMKYNFSLGGTDNGNVTSITNNRDNTRSQNFTYDSLNRLATAQTQTTGVTIPNSNCWGLTFGYDAWGNLLSSTISGPAGCGEPAPLSAPATTFNQISGFCYDAAGNLLVQGICPTGSNPTYTYKYDAENHLISTAGLTYSYDGDGRRIEKSGGKIYWYGMSSDPLFETDLLGNTNNSAFNEFVFFDGRRIARRDYQNNVFYYFADHLGTARAQVQAGQTNPCYDADFYPFGGERPITDTCDSTYKFTSKERDSESGLDNFGARFDSSTLGRFMSPDDFLKDSHVGDPRSWNKYTYARNNPLRYVDPTGENATVSTSCLTTNNQTTCNVNISASIAIYAAPGSGLTQEQLNGAASTIQSSIQNTWSGSFQQDGVTYNVSTQVSVQVAGSEGAASKTGAQNVIGLSNGPANAAQGSQDFTGHSNSLGTFLRGQDTGIWNYNTLGGATNDAAHEFSHLLGVDDHYDGNYVSNGRLANTPQQATGSDLRWGIQEATSGVKSWLNAPQYRPMRYGEVFEKPQTFSGLANVGVPSFGWWK